MAKSGGRWRNGKFQSAKKVRAINKGRLTKSLAKVSAGEALAGRFYR